VGDGRYHDLWETHRDAYKEEWETLTFHYDGDVDGAVDQDKISANPTLWLSAPAGWYPSAVYSDDS